MWSGPDAAAAPPPPQVCAAAIRRVDGTASAASAPAPCWRIGPLRLGMTQAEAERAIGSPDARFPLASDGSPSAYEAAAYLFPRGVAAELPRRPRADLPPLRTLQLLFQSGRLARIDTGLSYSLEVVGGAAACTASAHPGRAPGADPPSDFAPFRRFATLTLGEPIALAARQLGRPTVSTAGDFRAFHPAPITLDGQERLDGVSISTDETAQFLGASIRLVAHRRASDCAIDALTVAPPLP